MLTGDHSASISELQPLSDAESRLLSHCLHHGRQSWPIIKLGRGLAIEHHAIKFPSVYKTKRDACAQFSRWIDLAIERQAANP